MIRVNLESNAAFIIDQYVNRGRNTVQIAEMLGCDNTSVGRLLKRNGIPRIHTPNEIKLTDIQRRAICKAYADGATSIELSKSYGVCDGTIRKIVRENNMDIRPAKRRSIIKLHNYFHTIDSPEKAYFLGWLISDGCVVCRSKSGRSPAISLELKSADKYIIEMFADVLGADKSHVRDFQKRDHSYFRFASQEMADDLASYGVVERKSTVNHFPELSQEMMSHAIRGYFDGNGTVTIDRHGYLRFAFYGSQYICEELRQYLHEHIGLRLNTVGKSTCYHVWWGGISQARAFYDYIYADCGQLFLRRKREKFDSVL